MPLNIFMMLPGFGYTDPPPWLDKAAIDKKKSTTSPVFQPVMQQQNRVIQQSSPVEKRSGPALQNRQYQDYPTGTRSNTGNPGRSNPKR